MARRRVSIRTEDRVWHLRKQGYLLDHIGSITNLPVPTVCHVIQRVIRRPPLEEDPVRRGRLRGFLDDDQVADIRYRVKNGETQFSVAQRYSLSQSAVGHIVRGESYRDPEDNRTPKGYSYFFGNRLMAR